MNQQAKEKVHERAELRCIDFSMLTSLETMRGTLFITKCIDSKEFSVLLKYKDPPTRPVGVCAVMFGRRLAVGFPTLTIGDATLASHLP